MARASRELGEFYRQISEDIFKFCKALNFEPTNQQGRLFAAVQAGHRRIACKSGQGPGKTTAAAIIALWRSLRSYMALTIVTAPTMRQCRDVWLVEARRRLERADSRLKALINITKSKVEIAGQPDWGIKLVTATKEENAQGYHDKSMTVIGEEASGIPRNLITQFKGTLSNPDSLFLLIGNPNTRDCAFFDCFNSQRHAWHTMTFNAEDTARDYPHIVDPQRNADLADEFGKDSDVYRIRVLGEFPYADPNCVMSSEDLEKCCDTRNLLKWAGMDRDAEFGGGAVKQFGIDLARFGGDESTIYRRSGYSIVEAKKFAHTDPSIVLDIAFRMQLEAAWKDSQCMYIADAGGMGQGVMHKFYQAGKRVMEFHNGGTAGLPDYANKVTEAWFNMAKRVKKISCHIPSDNVLIKQLSGRRYFTNAKGKLVLEDKDQYMKRCVDEEYQSPDRADGCVMSFYDRVMVVGNLSTRDNSTHSVGQVVRR